MLLQEKRILILMNTPSPVFTFMDLFLSSLSSSPSPRSWRSLTLSSRSYKFFWSLFYSQDYESFRTGFCIRSKVKVRVCCMAYPWAFAVAPSFERVFLLLLGHFIGQLWKLCGNVDVSGCFWSSSLFLTLPQLPPTCPLGLPFNVISLEV